MLANVVGGMTSMYQYLSGDEVMGEKIDQMKAREKSTRLARGLEGSAATCSINDHQVLEKRIKNHAMERRTAKAISNLAHVVPGFSGRSIAHFAGCMLAESDLQREFIHQRMFYKVWEHHSQISVPRPISVTNTTLSMQYFPGSSWPCVHSIHLAGKMTKTP